MGDIFDEIAATYDRFRPPEPAVFECLLNCLRPVIQLKHLLDVGCGTGRYSIPLAKKLNANLTGIDTSSEMLSHARKKWPKGTWRLGSIERLISEIANRSVDVALFAYVLQFLKWQTVFLELSERIRCGGRILVITYEPDVFDRAPYHRFIPRLIAIDRNRFPNCSEVTDQLRFLGFEVERNVVQTVQRVENRQDIQRLVHQGRARYFSTLAYLEPLELEAGLLRLEHFLTEQIKIGPVTFTYEHTVIAAVRT